MKRFLSVLLMICFICAVSFPVLAASKKSPRKSVKNQPDQIEQLVRNLKPLNATNSKVILAVFKSYSTDKILVVSRGQGIDLISTKTNKRECVQSNMWYATDNIVKKACSASFNMMAGAVTFYNSNGKYMTSVDDAFDGLEDLAGLLIENALSMTNSVSSVERNSASLPVIFVGK